MNRRMTIVAVAALIIGIILGGGMIALAASPLQQADVAQWEYRVIECSGPASMDARYYVAVGNAVESDDYPVRCGVAIAQLGADGFELVAVVSDEDRLLHYFKRPQ